VRFEWDEKKNRANQKKHDVSFGLAQRVFDDPLALSRLDRVENGEQRWQTLGLVGETVVLLVVHTVQEEHSEEVIRIISARKATSRERRHYEQGETR
jgi:uncharacterized DUF497 family protein